MCAYCGREFEARRLRELRVHHTDARLNDPNASFAPEPRDSSAPIPLRRVRTPALANADAHDLLDVG